MASNLPRNAKALHFTGAVRALGVPDSVPASKARPAISPPESRGPRSRSPESRARSLPPPSRRADAPASRRPLESTVRPSTRMRALARDPDEDLKTPYLGVRPVALPAPRSRPTLNPPPPADLLDLDELELEEVCELATSELVLEGEDDTGDREPTVAFAREELAPVSSRAPQPPAARADDAQKLPIPHFRSPAEVAAAQQRPAAPVVVTVAPGAAAHTASTVTRPSGRGLPMFVWVLASIAAAMVSYHYAPSALRAAERAVGALEVR